MHVSEYVMCCEKAFNLYSCKRCACGDNNILASCIRTSYPRYCYSVLKETQLGLKRDQLSLPESIFRYKLNICCAIAEAIRKQRSLSSWAAGQAAAAV